MRVLLINDNYTLTGGAENTFFHLKNELKQTVGIHVYSLGFGPKAERGTDYQIFPAIRSQLGKWVWRLVIHPFLYRKLRQAIKTFQPDVIHLHNVKQYSATVLRAIKSYPTVQTVHDFSYVCPTGQNIHRDLTACRTGLRRACFWQHRVKYSLPAYFALALSFFSIRRKLKHTVQAFIAPSPLLVDYLQQNHFHHVTYIPPFRKEVRKNDLAVNPHQFLFAGHLAMHKGIACLLTEFALAVKTNPLLQLFIAGTGPDATWMQQEASRLNIAKNVRFLGWQTDLSSLYASSLAVLFPSIGLESFGLVITEAMAYARPVIGVNRGTAAWLIEDQQTGLLFNPLKPGDFADKILKLAKDINFANRLGTNGMVNLQKLSNNEQVLSSTIKTYKLVTPHTDFQNPQSCL